MPVAQAGDRAVEYVVIANPATGAPSLSMKDLVRVFKREDQYWKGKKSLQVTLVLPPGGSDEMQVARDKIYKMDVKGMKKCGISTIILDVNEIQPTIAAAVEEQAATTSERSRSVADASCSTADVSEKIGLVAEAALESTSGARDVQTAAAELSSLAVGMQSVADSANQS